ncbi:MAG: hypothetical protein M3R60_05905 [Pseudomonadota bacterium]|nr:hypothetical protein [Pseudomonadota bacterium]
MADIRNITPRSIDTTQRPAEKDASPTKSLRKGVNSPKLREQAGDAKYALLSPSSKQAKCIPLTSPRATQAAPASPYKSPSSRAATSTSAIPPSPRAYLEGLNSDNLANSILRDQTSANADNYPTAWIGEVQASLEEPVGKLLELAPIVLAAAEKKKLKRLFPEIGSDAKFDWQPFNNLAEKLWPHFSALIISPESLPPRTLGLLAEFRAELGRLPAFGDLKPAARDKAFSDALFNLLVWNGIFSPLIKSVPEQYQRLINGLCTYVKVAWNMQAQSQGNIGNMIAAMVPAGRVKQCAEFCVALTAQVERLAALRAVEFQDEQRDLRLNQLREQNIDRHFTDTWLIRTDDYAEVVDQGRYYLTDADGLKHRCKSYEELEKYVGSGSKGTLAEVVLHVAGARIRNFLTNTYLYDLETPLFTDAQGQRVDPVANLDTTFILGRGNDGKITVTCSSCDHAVKSAMLVRPGSDDSGIDAVPLFQASLEFHGEMRFYPSEEFEAGPIRLTGQNLHMFE